MQSWFRIPKWLSRTSNKVFSFLGLVDDSEEFTSRSVLMGATPEIHEDMLYDYAMQRERMMPRRFGPGNVNVSGLYQKVKTYTGVDEQLSISQAFKITFISREYFCTSCKNLI